MRGSIGTWFRRARVRRGLAASIVVLAAGGMVLFRTPADARPGILGPLTQEPLPSGPNTVAFAGPAAHGTLALSHTRLLAGGERRLFAEVRLVADAAEQARERAPLSLAVVIDTSGSMEGEKIAQAKDAVIGLLRDMRDDDEIALVRYSSDSELLQPLARVGAVRSALIDKVRAISAGGGTNIAPALSHGLTALGEAGKGRVRRVVLVSDGLDSTRAQSESIASRSAGQGVTISTMGIGLDFDEAYMGGVARSGRGNLAFVKDATTLATFLGRELKEGATTTIEGATARIALPRGVRLVRALGADASMTDASGRDGALLELRMGSLFAGDERRVVVELAAQLDSGEVRGFDGDVRWDRVGGGAAEAHIGRLEISGTTDASAVDASRDGAVFASAMSAIASTRQLEAAQAYGQGDGARARALIDQNMADLDEAAAVAPAPARAALEKQKGAYDATRSGFAAAPPSSPEGKAAAKASVAKDSENIGRKAAF